MKPGTNVLVKFPFSDLESSKKRPALVLHSLDHSKKIKLVTISMITSQMNGLGMQGDVSILEWEKSKLLHPSLVRLSKIATVNGDLVVKTLGHLTDKDRVSVKKMFKVLFQNCIA